MIVVLVRALRVVSISVEYLCTEPRGSDDGYLAWFCIIPGASNRALGVTADESTENHSVNPSKRSMDCLSFQNCLLGQKTLPDGDPDSLSESLLVSDISAGVTFHFQNVYSFIVELPDVSRNLGSARSSIIPSRSRPPSRQCTRQS
jgi:hypothetical protein